MTELNKLIKWLEDRIDILCNDTPGDPSLYVDGRRDEAKFILKHVPVSSEEIAEAGAEKLKPAEWIERVQEAYSEMTPVLHHCEIKTAFSVNPDQWAKLSDALCAPIDWSDDEALTNEQYNCLLAHVAGEKPRSDK